MKKFIRTLTALVILFAFVFQAYAATDASEPEYMITGNELILGPNEVVLQLSDCSALYSFVPPSPGIYTFSADSEDVQVGFWGTRYYIHDVTGDGKSNSLTYTITEPGPTLLIGLSGASACTLTITRAEYTPPTVSVTEYENLHTPEQFSLEHGEHLLAVDAFDSHEDTAILGADGYFRLNSSDGPVLYLNFSGPINFREALSLHQLTYYTDNTTKYDCNRAMEEYISCAEENWDVYPLTEDLAHMVQELTKYKDWYRFLDIPEGNWLFNCCYVYEEPEEICPTAGYQDVLNPSWYHHDLDNMVEMGFIHGKSQTIMDPDGMLTRAELVQLLYNIAGQPDAGISDLPFTDVSADDWFYDAVAWAYHQETPIVNGMTECKFVPNTNITREQVAVILHRYSGCPRAEGDLNGFSDRDRVSSYAVDALIWATKNDIIKGIVSERKLCLHPSPSVNTDSLYGLTTRAQAAVMLARYLDK